MIASVATLVLILAVLVGVAVFVGLAVALLEDQCQGFYDEFAIQEHVCCSTPRYSHSDLAHVELHGCSIGGDDQRGRYDVR